MKKLRLHTDDVQVESFITASRAALKGTVDAKSDTVLGCYSFEYTCWNRGCNTGLTAPEYCTAGETDIGVPGCYGTTQNKGYTCDNTCSDYGCTVCVAWC